MKRPAPLVALTVLYVGSGVLLVGLAVPLIARRVPPNRFYGFRVPETLQDTAVWYSVNAFAGAALLVAGVVVVATALLARRWSAVLTSTRYTLVCSGALLISVVLAMTASLFYLNTLPV